MKPKFVCPACWNDALEENAEGRSCPRCGASFPIRRGANCFVVPDKSWKSIVQDTVALLVDFKANMEAAEKRHAGDLKEKLDAYAAPFVAERDEDLHKALAILGVPKEASLLEVGAGDLRTATSLHAAGWRDLTAVEPVPEFLCRDHYPGHESIRKVCASASRLPFPDDSFDAVLAQACLHHMTDIAATLREMLRVAKPGGWIVAANEPFSPILSDPERVKAHHADEAYNIGAHESLPRVREYLAPIAPFASDIEAWVWPSLLRAPRALRWLPSLAGGGADMRRLRGWRMKLVCSLHHGGLTLVARKRASPPKPRPVPPGEFLFDPEAYLAVRHRRVFVDIWKRLLDDDEAPRVIEVGKNDQSHLRRGFAKVGNGPEARRHLLAKGGFFLRFGPEGKLRVAARNPPELGLRSLSIAAARDGEPLGELALPPSNDYIELAWKTSANSIGEIELEASETAWRDGSPVSAEILRIAGE